MDVRHRIGPSLKRRRLWLAAALALALAGCLPLPLPGPIAEKEPNGDKPAGESTKREVVLGPAISLAEAGIEVSPPKGWHEAERTKTKIRFTPSENVGYPSILVTAPPDFTGELATSTDEVAELAERIQVAEQMSGDAKLKVNPVQIDGFQGAEYRSKRQVSAGEVNQLVLVTAANGYRYTVELHMLGDALHKYQPELYAVAAALKFFPRPTEDKPAAAPSGDKTGKN